MANQNDRFIDEVTDELRRDRLFSAMRRYGWIAIALIVAMVGASAWFEFARNRTETKAQLFGDAVVAAQALPDPAERAKALAAIDPQGADRAILRDLLAAGAEVEAGAVAPAGERLAAAASMAGEAAGDDRLLQHLALLKSVLAQGAAMNPADRDAALATLSATGAPFELMALELKAVALVGADRPDDAVALIRQVQEKDGLTEPMRRRLAEMMITLGVDPEPSTDLPDADLSQADLPGPDLPGPDLPGANPPGAGTDPAPASPLPAPAG